MKKLSFHENTEISQLKGTDQICTPQFLYANIGSVSTCILMSYAVRIINKMLPDNFTSTILQFQLVVQAYDNGNPPLYDTEVVTITVERNTQPPVFNPAVYQVTILETQSLGSTILTVTATDPDALFVRVVYIFRDSQSFKLILEFSSIRCYL